LDFGVRFSVNLMGGPAMPAEKFAKWKQKLLLGASLRVIAPTGQYDPTKLVNWGINRWAFKPEFGYSEQWRNWLVDAYAGAWFYTSNPASYNIPAPNSCTQTTNGTTYWRFGRSFEPQLQVRYLGITGRQLLVGWCHELERHTESCY
jgi:hypothetical protein